MVITTYSHKEIKDVRVRKGINLDSDHYLTEIKTKFLPNKPTPKRNRSQNINTEFLIQNKDKFCDILNTRKMGDWEEIKEAMMEADKELGEPRRIPRHMW